MSVKLFSLFSFLLILPIAVLAGETPPEPVLRLNFEQCKDGLYIGPGAYGGVACQPGKFGTAGDFDGIDDGVEIEDSPAYHFTDALTLAAGVRPDTILGLNTIVNKWYAMDSYMLLIEDGKFVFVVAFPGGTWGTTVSVEAPAVAGKWTHVAGVYDGSFIMLYLNGTMVASEKASGDIQQSTRPISIGNHPSWNAYDGLIDEVRLYDTALTPPQVNDLASILSLDKPIIFSQGQVRYKDYATKYPVAHINDGDYSTMWYTWTNYPWSSKYQAKATIDLEDECHIGKFMFKVNWDSRPQYGTEAEIRIKVSDDNEYWTTVATKTVSRNEVCIVPYITTAITTARYAKIEWVGGNGRYHGWNGWGGIYEFEVYGSPQSSCSNNKQCPFSHYCAKAVGNCDGWGTCQPRPEYCIDIWDPVCGCDGRTYSNECYAARNGVNVDYAGKCGDISVR